MERERSRVPRQAVRRQHVGVAQALVDAMDEAADRVGAFTGRVTSVNGVTGAIQVKGDDDDVELGQATARLAGTTYVVGDRVLIVPTKGGGFVVVGKVVV